MRFCLLIYSDDTEVGIIMGNISFSLTILDNGNFLAN